MLKVMMIGNLTFDPELRSTPSGVSVCGFTVAVNYRNKEAEAGDNKAEFIKVTAWRGLAETCNRYLKKGDKVGVVGNLMLKTFIGNDGQTKAQIAVTADEVEFLSQRRDENSSVSGTASGNNAGGFVDVSGEEMPWM